MRHRALVWAVAFASIAGMTIAASPVAAAATYRTISNDVDQFNPGLYPRLDITVVSPTGNGSYYLSSVGTHPWAYTVVRNDGNVTVTSGATYSDGGGESVKMLLTDTMYNGSASVSYQVYAYYNGKLDTAYHCTWNWTSGSTGTHQCNTSATRSA
jgi:hypothetical protein